MINSINHESRICSNPFADSVYKAGVLLTKPFLYQANLATKVFSGHLRPGKKFDNLPLSGKIVKILKISTFFTIVVPLVTGVLAALGLLLRSLASYSRPAATLLRNSTIPFKEFQSGQKTNFTVYNAALLPKFICNLSNMRSPNARADEIGLMFQMQTEPPDVLCMQECFSLGATIKLSGHLKKIYPEILYFADPKESGLNSGLLIASKFKIQDIDSYRYNATASEDALANKGALGISIRLNENETCWIYNTHLQAKHAEQYELVRDKQLLELRQHIEKNKDNDAYTFVIGDFNKSKNDINGERIPGYRHDFLGEEYINLSYESDKKLESETELPSIRGCWYKKTDTTWGTSTWNKSIVDDCIFDHIFMKKNKKYVSATTILNMPDEKGVSGQSDHILLNLEVTL